MSAYPDTKPSYAADNAAPYRSSPGPYRSSPVPVNTAALPASPVNAVVYGSTPQMGGPQSAGASGMLRRGQSLYSQQRDVRVQNPPLHQGAMASLVGSMGALSLAQSQQQAGITMSQPTLVGSATMPTPYARGTQPPLQLGNSCCVGGAAENSQASLGVPANPQQSQPKAAPVVQSQATLLPPGPPDLSGSVATLAQPDCTSPFPLWSNISANSFDAYQHQVPVKQSNLTGTKYALIIGINYYELEYSQTSNINSAHSIKLLLMSRYGYQEQNIILLSDGLEDERCHPTFRGITAAIERMMSQVKPNDAVFFYFCGFGHLPYQLRDRRTEVLGAIRHLRCDYILPSDFECMGAIDAEYLHHFLVRQLPSSARLTALFNCIINETGLGVPYKYTHLNGGPVLTNAIAGKNLFEAGMNLNQMSTASFGDLSQRLESSLIQQQQRRRQQQSSGSAGALVTAEDIVRIRQSSGDIIVFGWDRNFKDPEYKKSLGQTPSNQLGSYWAAAMENAINTKGKATFGDVISYMEGVTKDLVMLPFVACGRKIRMDEVLVI
ncbi:Ca(2+)-dependent cysteine protease [Coemansia sp. RSA 552]|nr:Ca(2+)-dependent cysteine protease [Coemansia sp. RSA 552]